MFDKHVTPNLVALAVILASFLFPDPWRDVVLGTGLFALSGALTNWLAVHMLFERVPGLYGSGVITLHFEEFKAGILHMVHDELFSREKVERLLQGVSNDPDAAEHGSEGASGSGEPASKRPVSPALDLEPMLAGIDLDAAYDQLVATIVESSFGNMLAMVGGEAALQPLREPFKQRLHKFLVEAARSPRVQAAVRQQLTSTASTERFIAKLDAVLRARLDELTPVMVRDLIQRMIRRHLGWLVVWGGVFGGLIGLAVGLLRVAGVL